MSWEQVPMHHGLPYRLEHSQVNDVPNPPQSGNSKLSKGLPEEAPTSTWTVFYTALLLKTCINNADICWHMLTVSMATSTLWTDQHVSWGTETKILWPATPCHPKNLQIQGKQTSWNRPPWLPASFLRNPRSHLDSHPCSPKPAGICQLTSDEWKWMNNEHPPCGYVKPTTLLIVQRPIWGNMFIRFQPLERTHARAHTVNRKHAHIKVMHTCMQCILASAHTQTYIYMRMYPDRK